MTKNYKSRLFTLIIAGLGFFSAQGQTTEKPMCIELNGGYREYLGDLGSSLFFKKRPDYQGIGLNFGYQVKPFIDAVVNFSTGDVGYHTIVQWEIPERKVRGFRANTMDLALGLRLKIGSLLQEDPKINPYIYAGFGGYYVHSAIARYVQHLTDMGANVQFGGGVNFQLTETWGLRWSWTGNYTMNDIWDGENGDPNKLVHGLYRTNDLWSHHAIGITFNFGTGNVTTIKDKDQDGVPDKIDLCKNTPEKYRNFVDSNGCNADTDRDSILDADDPCPTAWGPRKFNGCPDTDGDGIEDKLDACPKVAGLAAFNGCPDSDGDGVQDKDDQCPNVAGAKEFNGCPDSDGDGIEDRKDKCPKVAGTAEGEGCPDTDGDGVYDNRDKCPTVAGVPELRGCPEMKKEVKQKLALAAKGIKFEVNKAVITTASYKNLDTLVNILNSVPEAKVVIEGNTDSDGEADKNLKLSQERADAVKAYLIAHGVSEARLTSIGYGETRPVLVNGKEDKTQSRRVDFVFKYED